MAGALRVGVLHASGSELNQSVQEQLLGARLAASFTRDSWPASAPTLDLAERAVSSDLGSVDIAARYLVDQGCRVLLGALTVPLSVQAARWAEAEGMLYIAGNNNPQVRDGRRHVFHIGVPSEVTAEAVARYLHDERSKRRVGVLHTGGDFQVHAAACMVKSMRERAMAVESERIGEDPSGDGALLGRVREWGPDALCVLGSELERVVELVKAAGALGSLPPMVGARGLLCREFVELAGEAGEGHEFTDLYLRDSRAPDEEKALHQRLAGVDPRLVATASHGFGWDGLRLLAEAWRAAGPDADEQVAFLEASQGYSGATGLLTFTQQDHAGRARYDPTTIARLVGGRYNVVSTLGR